MFRTRFMFSLAVSAAMGFGIIAGCRTTVDQATSPLLTKQDQATTINAALAKTPIDLVAGTTSQRLDLIDVSKSMPVGQDLRIAVSVNPEALSIALQSPTPGAKTPSEPTLDIVLTIGDSFTDACDAGLPAGRVTIGVDQKGGLLSIANQGAVISGPMADAVRAGKVVLCSQIVSNFSGNVRFGEVLIDAALPPVELPARDGGVTLVSVDGDDNSNDNTDDIGDDNGNDNTDDVGDDNGNDNGTDDVGEDNANDNAEDVDDNGNDNIDDVGDDNGNDNVDDNANDNADDNGNDNTNPDGSCPNGEFRLRADDLVGAGGEELEAEYRLLPGGCERFRVKVEAMAAGTYDVTINGVVVGQIIVGGEGEGELEFDTEDGNFPIDFPELQIDDVLGIGSSLTGALPLDCSHETHVCPGA